MKIKLAGFILSGLCAAQSAAFAAAPSLRPATTFQHLAVNLGSNALFTVSALGSTPLRYQWWLEGQPLPGKTNATLLFTNAQPADEGDYTVVVTNVYGAVTSNPVRLWVVPTAAGFVKGNLTNAVEGRLPYYFLLPTGYNAGRAYPLYCLFHGTPGDEIIMTGGGGYIGYLNMAALKVQASCRQQSRDPAILLCPTRRAGDSAWTDSYLRLVSNLLDKVLAEFSVDTNRIYVIGGSEGVHAAWDMIAMRPGFFAAAQLIAGWQGNAQSALVKDVPCWAWCAADDSLVTDTRALVRDLRLRGNHTVYTEYNSGGHLDGIFMGGSTPAIVDWLLAQRRGVPSTAEPRLAITSPVPNPIYITGATNLNLAGSAAALGQSITQVTWENVTSGRTGSATGKNLWSVTNLPLKADKTNTIILTATTTSWADGFGGSTTFIDILTAVSSPIRASLTLEAAGPVLNWRGGAPPFQVERASRIAPADWLTLLTNATPPLALPLESAPAFFRVLGQ
jgi:poly(3-hydroxybutyrate) depolymerase